MKTYIATKVSGAKTISLQRGLATRKYCYPGILNSSSELLTEDLTVICPLPIFGNCGERYNVAIVCDVQAHLGIEFHFFGQLNTERHKAESFYWLCAK